MDKTIYVYDFPALSLQNFNAIYAGYGNYGNKNQFIANGKGSIKIINKFTNDISYQYICNHFTNWKLNGYVILNNYLDNKSENGDYLNDMKVGIHKIYCNGNIECITYYHDNCKMDEIEYPLSDEIDRFYKKYKFH